MERLITFKRSKHPVICIMMMFTYLLFSFKLSGQSINLLPFGRTTQSVLTEAYVDGNWQNFSNITNTFGDDTHLERSLYQEWDADTGIWVDKIQAGYATTFNGDVRQVIYQTMTADGIWENTQRVTYSYKEVKQVLTVITDNWSNGNWAAFSKQTNTYDGAGFLTNSLIQNIDQSSGALTNNTQINFVNFPGGKINIATTQTWDIITTDSWINSQRTIYSYDTNSYLLNTMTQKWQLSVNDWRNDSMSNFTNDFLGNSIQVLSQIADPVLPDTWNNSTRTTITYNTLDVADFDKTKTFTVYPIPASDRIMIEANDNEFQASNYLILDETGRTVIKGRFDAESRTVDISQLSRGQYFFQIGQGKSKALKIIKD